MKNLVDSRLANVYLKPGEVFVSRTPALVSTVLGSCVSVTLFSPSARMGAICHAMLPNGADHDPLRYVDSAVDYIYAQLAAISGQSGGFEAKLFGGANVLVQGANQQAAASVGCLNVEAAMRAIERLGLKLISFDTGGEQGRKIFFYSGTGEVYLRPVKKSIRS
jgi:chemotaxis protein CheD